MLGEGAVSKLKDEWICCRIDGSGVVMTAACSKEEVVGFVTKTVSLVENGEGRWRMLSRSAWDVNENDPSYGSRN